MMLHKQPVWRLQREYRYEEIPNNVRPWLFDMSSLTDRVKAACGDRTFRVDVLEQHYQKPLSNESRRLKLKFEHYALIREVRLLCDEVPWVYARSIIPLNTLTGPQRRLAYLGDKPLGAALFADRTMHRGEVEITKIMPQHRILGNNDSTSTIWGRRSLFWLGCKPLLVAEYFLPTLIRN